MNKRSVTLWIASIAFVTAECFIAGSSGQQGSSQQKAPDLMIQYGCPTCHVIPKVPGAVGKVGPSLSTISQHSYLAGSLPNTPENLIRWIMHPQKYRPGTAMPEMASLSRTPAPSKAFSNRCGREGHPRPSVLIATR